MSKLVFYSNRHIKDQASKISKGDCIVTENALSEKRWKRYIEQSGKSVQSLKLTYISIEEFLTLNKQFDEIVGNPPFSKNGGNSDQLYPIFLNKGMDTLVKPGGFQRLVTPPTFTSGTKQLTDTGRINLLVKMTTDHNLVHLDYRANNEFKNIGSKFVTSTVQVGVPYKGKTKITTVEGDEFDIDLTGVSCLPNVDMIQEKYLKMFTAMQRKQGEKFYFKFCSNTAVKSSEYKDEPSARFKHKYLNASSNHGIKYACKPNTVGTHFVHSCYMGSHHKFEYVLNKDDVSVMHNARVWLHPDLKKTSQKVLRSIFESDLFKETVYSYKFTQYNEMSFINSIAIPPLDRVWTDKELRKWYLS